MHGCTVHTPYNTISRFYSRQMHFKLVLRRYQNILHLLLRQTSGLCVTYHAHTSVRSIPVCTDNIRSSGHIRLRGHIGTCVYSQVRISRLDTTPHMWTLAIQGHSYIDQWRGYSDRRNHTGTPPHSCHHSNRQHKLKQHNRKIYILLLSLPSIRLK